jgi:DNA ligase (NAD+)
MILDLLINEVKDGTIEDHLTALKATYTQLENIICRLDEYDIAYFIESKPIVEDSEYDLVKSEMYKLMSTVKQQMNGIEKLLLSESNLRSVKRVFAEMKRIIKKREFKVGAKPSRHFKKAAHRRPMLSLTNCFTQDDVERFMKNISLDKKIACELKIDGVSFSAIYENGQLKVALTRGDGAIGEDITLNVKQISQIPLEIEYKDTVEIRGEIYMDKESFSRLNGFSNPRNAASGSIRQLNPMITKQRNLQYFIWDADFQDIQSHYKRMVFAKELGFCTNQHISLVDSISQMIHFYEQTILIRSSLDYDIDGVVYKVDNIAEQERLGYTANAPRWATAHKFQAMETITEIKDIIIQIGKSGVLVPVALLEPVNIGGAIIKRATLHNACELQRQDYRVGDIVRLIRSGDVIPKINGVFRKSTTAECFVFPKNCPICNSAVVDDKTSTHKICTGGWRCKGQLIERLNHFVSRGAFNIIGLGNKQIEYLVNHKIINTYVDIFKLNERNTIYTLQEHQGWGNKSVSELFNAINNARKIEFNRFIYSLSISHVGVEIAALLAQHSVNYENLIQIINHNNSYEILTEVNGIGEQIANSIIQFFKDQYNQELLEALLSQVEIIPYKMQSIGDVYACTGTLSSMTRAEVAEVIEKKLGGIFTTSITTKVKILVVGSDPSIAKVSRAKLLNIQRLNEAEFIALIANT